MTGKGRRRFQTAGTVPNADELPDAKTPRRPDATTSAPKARSAFTWRLTPEQALELDTLVLRLRSELGTSRLDRATMLEALVSLPSENQAIYGALLARLQDAQTS